MNFCIGSCRVCYLFPIQCYPTDFMHTTKEVIQLISLLKMDAEQLHTYYSMNGNKVMLMNRTYSSLKKFLNGILNIKTHVARAQTIVIEVSSLKQYCLKPNNVYCQSVLLGIITNNTIGLKQNQQHLRQLYPCSEEIKQNIQIVAQTELDLQSDLQHIYEYVVTTLNKKLVLVPHVNCVLPDGTYIPSRVTICNNLQSFSSAHDSCEYFNPMNYLPNDYAFVFDNGNSGHYSKQAFDIVNKSMHKYIC